MSVPKAKRRPSESEDLGAVVDTGAEYPGAPPAKEAAADLAHGPRGRPGIPAGKARRPRRSSRTSAAIRQ
ncbi:hypothetical protein GCM10023335_15930 [Streptomyces siamensis]|uniref:Uncharacterized protein n=1 Tax=Streptomyces siamensis TaxID=1274986 RepID=A0ABP9IL32_9ACTN